MDSSKRDKVLALVSEVTGTAAADIQDDQNLVADLGIDSSKALRLLVELEDAFDCEIPDEDASGLATVADLLAYLAAKA